LAGGDHIHGGDSPELLGILLQGSVWRTGGTRRKPSLGRIEQRQRQDAGWPELTGAELVAAAGVRASTTTSMQRAAGAADGGVGLLRLC
jgi:hypothetical protein